RPSSASSSHSRAEHGGEDAHTRAHGRRCRGGAPERDQRRHGAAGRWLRPDLVQQCRRRDDVQQRGERQPWVDHRPGRRRPRWRGVWGGAPAAPPPPPAPLPPPATATATTRPEVTVTPAATTPTGASPTPTATTAPEVTATPTATIPAGTNPTPTATTPTPAPTLSPCETGLGVTAALDASHRLQVTVSPRMGPVARVRLVADPRVQSPNALFAWPPGRGRRAPRPGAPRNPYSLSVDLR